jgi:hypothetical protein
MTKKILYLILGAIFAFGLLFLLWSWLFSGGNNSAQNNGQFGTAGNATQNSLTGVNSNNGETNLGQNGINGTNGSNAVNGTIALGNNGTGNTNGNVNTNTTGTTSTAFGTMSSVPGVTWLGSPFNPTGINGLSSGAGGFTPTITTTNNPGNGGTTLLEALAATAIAGSLTCAIQAGLVTLSTAGTTFTAPTSIAVTAAMTPAPPYNPYGLVAGTGPLIVADFGTRTILGAQYGQGAVKAGLDTGDHTITFMGCITNVIAKTALQQITSSVVNWINSGFRGQPSFVTNFQQFFTNVADIAAGQFIQGGPLSFLCSPFKLQIKIAVAQSYANRNNAQSCTLTKVIGNINSFMNGNFSQGGWPGLISYTTTPTNNPYGAYAYAQIGLVSAQQNAIANAKNNISPTGFLSSISLGQAQSCHNTTTIVPVAGQNSQAAAVTCPPGCTCSVATPGSVIEASLDKTITSGVDQLGLASDIDQIINALITQLMTRVLQNGLGSLSQTTTQTPADLAAESQATSLLNDIQSNTTIAEQLGSIYQGSISDIENAQASLSNLVDCWNSVAASTNSTSAAQNAATASSTIQTLEAQVTVYNDDITQINSEIAELNQFALQISTAASPAAVKTITDSYNAAVSAGTFPSQTDLTTAQQNRTTLQSQLASLNSTTQSSLAQCQASGN